MALCLCMRRGTLMPWPRRCRLTISPRTAPSRAVYDGTRESCPEVRRTGWDTDSNARHSAVRTVSAMHLRSMLLVRVAWLACSPSRSCLWAALQPSRHAHASTYLISRRCLASSSMDGRNVSRRPPVSCETVSGANKPAAAGACPFSSSTKSPSPLS
jgi:hypothetical protein